jgi:hypothetical protein
MRMFLFFTWSSRASRSGRPPPPAVIVQMSQTNV